MCLCNSPHYSYSTKKKDWFNQQIVCGVRACDIPKEISQPWFFFFFFYTPAAKKKANKKISQPQQFMLLLIIIIIKKSIPLIPIHKYTNLISFVVCSLIWILILLHIVQCIVSFVIANSTTLQFLQLGFYLLIYWRQQQQIH